VSTVLTPPRIRLWSDATHADLDAMAEIEGRAYAWPWTRKNLDDSLRSGYRMELLRSPDRVVGYSVAMQAVDEMHLLNLTVAPEFQRQGHGRALLRRLMAQSREKGLIGIWLEARASNQNAMALYEQSGFARVNLRRGYYPCGAGPREDAWVMHCNLERHA
jgi:[ribosomal protein S18]-alanine N-acetyltransferase